jgi:hypothetical protein
MTSMTCRLVAALLVVSLIGCSGGPTSSLPIARPRPDGRPAPVDRSASITEYLKAGVPALNRPWSPSDLSIAVDVLNGVAREELPRYQSQRSGDLFSRITTCITLESVRADEGAVVDRMRLAAQWMKSGQEILKLYFEAMSQNAVGGDEVVELMGAQLRGSVVVIGLTNEFVPTLDMNDPTYQNRMAGVVQTRFGLAITLEGAIVALQERDNYSRAQRLRLLGYVKTTGPKVFPFLAPESQASVLQRLETLCDDEQMSDLQPNLNELLGMLKAGVKPAKP